MKSRFINALLATFSVAIALLLIETALRIQPSIAGKAFANGIRSSYRISEDGIYFMHPGFPLTRLMKPHQDRTLTYNGHYWRHQTDAYGFRNAKDRARGDALLLGDSFIYGHGLNHEETVGARLEKSTGLSVVNLARQGDTILQQVCLLNAFIKTYRPKFVVHFFYQNDIADIRDWLSVSERRRLASAPITDLPCSRDPNLGPPSLDSSEPPRDQRPYILRLWRGRPSFRRAAARAYFKLLGKSDPFEVVADVDSPEWAIMRRGLRQMNLLTKSHQAKLLFAPIATSNDPVLLRQAETFRRIVGEEGLVLLDTRSLDGGGQGILLDGDAHFSADGASRLSEIVAAALKERL